MKVKLKFEELSNYQKFLKIYKNSYFNDFLKDKNICPMPADYIYKFMEPYMDMITSVPKKAQYSKMPAAFIICPINNIETSLNQILNINGQQKGRKIKSVWKNLYGQEQANFYIEEYENLLNNRPEKTDRQNREGSIICEEYWIKRGYSQEEAKIKIKERQSKNAKKRDIASYKDMSNYSGRIEYWLSKGYSQEEAEEKRKDAVFNMIPRLDSLIKRYGKEEGTNRHNKKSEKFKESMKDENGAWKGYVRTSKESIKFFITIYKFLRKHGIKKEDIYWGIRGSKEYYLNRGDGKIYSYDFTIKSLNVIIEYHGSGWHPIAPFKIENRKIIGTFLSNYATEEELYYKDIDKMNLARSKGFNIYPIWSDESNKQEKIISIIERYLNE